MADNYSFLDAFNFVGQKHAKVDSYIKSALDSYNTGISKEQFYSMNIVDATDVSMEDMNSVRTELIQYCKDNGCYAALPPFEEGAFIDKSERRYFHWKVLEVQEDYYRMELDYYPLLIVDFDTTGKHEGIDFRKLSHPCWYLAGRTTVKVKVLSDAEYIEMLSHIPEYVDHEKELGNHKDEILHKFYDLLKSMNYVGGAIEGYEYYYTKDLMKIRKKGKYSTPNGEFINGAWIRQTIDATLEHVADRGRHSMLFVSAGPIIEMFTYINYMLSLKSTSSSTLRKITSIYVPNSEHAETRKERHFGKLKMISEKKPRAINAHNIQRIYTTMSWQRRSHIRHLASGKIVPVKSAICKRHNADDAIAPQVVYKA